MIESNSDIGWLLGTLALVVFFFVWLIAIPIYDNWRWNRQEKLLRELHNKQRAAFAARRKEQVS